MINLQGLILVVGVTGFLLVYLILILGETSLLLIRYGKMPRTTLDALASKVKFKRLMNNGQRVGEALRFGKMFCLLVTGALIYGFLSLFQKQVSPDVLSIQWGWIFVSLFFFLLILFLCGELLPRNLALRYPLKSLRFAVPVLRFLEFLLIPVRLIPLKQLFSEHLGVKEIPINPLDISVQLRAMGEDDQKLSPVIRRMVDRAIQMQDLVVHDVLLPRNEVIIFDTNKDIATNLVAMKRAGHTRYPICKGDLDECIGIIHIKDIFRNEVGEWDFDLDSMMRPTSTFSLEMPLEEALQRMLRTKFHMGIVCDSFGGALGVVTLERILEELVGNIQDEFDSEEELITSLPKQRGFKILGQTPIHEVESHLGVKVENETVSTFGGLIMSELGRIPETGFKFEAYGMGIEILEVDDRRVLTAAVQSHPQG